MKTIDVNKMHEIEQLLSQCKVCHVGMCSLDGFPYVVPMNYGYADGVLYLHSGPHGRKQSILEQNPRVCITLYQGDRLVCQNEEVACSYSMRTDSVMIEGSVEFIADDDLSAKRNALDCIMAAYVDSPFSYSDPALRNVKVWKVTVQNPTMKAIGLTYHEARERTHGK